LDTGHFVDFMDAVGVVEPVDAETRELVQLKYYTLYPGRLSDVELKSKRVVTRNMKATAESKQQQRPAEADARRSGMQISDPDSSDDEARCPWPPGTSVFICFFPH
jgi:hypothetical protein